MRFPPERPRKWSTRLPGRAGPRPNRIRPLDERLGQPAQQGAALLQADQGIIRLGLEVAGERRRIDALEPEMVDAAAGIGRETAGAEHVEAGNGEPLGAREGGAGFLFAVAPGIAGAGIEQDAHGREVDRHAGPLNRIDIETRRELAPTIDAAGREMAPAAVIGNPQIGIGFARDVRDIARDRFEPAFIEGEMRRASLRHPAPHHAAALAHGGGITQLLGRARRLSEDGRACTCPVTGVTRRDPARPRRRNRGAGGRRQSSRPRSWPRSLRAHPEGSSRRAAARARRWRCLGG